MPDIGWLCQPMLDFVQHAGNNWRPVHAGSYGCGISRRTNPGIAVHPAAIATAPSLTAHASL